MDPSLFTNQTFIEFFLQLLAAYGLPWVVSIGVLIFVLFVVYKILKKKNIIGNPLPPIFNTEPIIDKLIEINLTLKSNGKSLDLLLDRQAGYLKEEQAHYVLDNIIENLIYKLMKKIMEIYIANNICNNESLILDSLKLEIETLIKETHREADLVPNLTNYTKPLKEQLKVINELSEKIINIMKKERIEKEAARKIKSLISTCIKINWLV